MEDRQVHQINGSVSSLPGSMRSDMYGELYSKESSYWWHRGKRWMLHDAIRTTMNLLAGRALVVDLGCGTGAFVEEVDRYALGVGVDGAPEALRFCRQRGVARLCAANLDMRHLPFSDRSVNAVILADCLEHTLDDVALLRESARILVDGGILVVVVPAYRWLWSYWDVISGHHRRYTWATLSCVIGEAGLVTKRHTYILMSLLPVAVIQRTIRQVRFRNDPEKAGSEFIPLPGFVNELLFRLYRLEARLAAYASLPFGLSIMAVCSKPRSRV